MNRDFWAKEAEMMRDKSHLEMGTVLENLNEVKPYLKTGATIEIRYVNDTEEGMSGRHILSQDALKKVIEGIFRIYKRNGLDKNLKLTPISLNEAKKYGSTSSNIGFLAFISSYVRSYGSTDKFGHGEIGVYNSRYSVGNAKSWSSWVNYGVIAEEKVNFPNVIDSTSFIAAHEILHQLLYFASIKIDKLDKFGHTGGSPNLNMAADDSDFKYSLRKGNDFEVILPEHKTYLNNFFNSF